MSNGQNAIMLCNKIVFLFHFHRYADLIGKAEARHNKLEESIKKNAMLREAKEIESWMTDCVSIKNYFELCIHCTQQSLLFFFLNHHM